MYETFLPSVENSVTRSIPPPTPPQKKKERKKEKSLVLPLAKTVAILKIMSIFSKYFLIIIHNQIINSRAEYLFQKYYGLIRNYSVY